MEINRNQIWQKDGYRLRFAQLQDADRYYEQNFHPLDPEAARMTGSQKSFSKDEVLSFFQKAAADPNRIFLLLESKEGNIIGESMINEVDWKAKTANFRIAIYSPTERSRGLGTWMSQITRDLAFENFKLEKLELDVFSFNSRAIQTYKKAGFHQEGICKNSIENGETAADTNLMAIDYKDWLALKKVETS